MSISFSQLQHGGPGEREAQGHQRRKRLNLLNARKRVAMSSKQLKPNCLSYMEVLAQAVALISPTMTAALIIPVMYSNTGDWSWMSYALGTVMLLFVAFNLNQFARRSTMSGSMYAYICRGLGLTAGAVGGWSLIWAYLGIAMAGVTGFTIFAGKLLAMMGVNVSPFLLFAVCVGVAWFCAWKDVRLSAVMMLVCEGVSGLTVFLNQSDRDYCMTGFLSRGRANGLEVCGAGGR